MKHPDVDALLDRALGLESEADPAHCEECQRAWSRLEEEQGILRHYYTRQPDSAPSLEPLLQSLREPRPEPVRWWLRVAAALPLAMALWLVFAAEGGPVPAAAAVARVPWGGFLFGAVVVAWVLAYVRLRKRVPDQRATVASVLADLGVVLAAVTVAFWLEGMPASSGNPEGVRLQVGTIQITGFAAANIVLLAWIYLRFGGVLGISVGRWLARFAMARWSMPVVMAAALVIVPQLWGQLTVQNVEARRRRGEAVSFEGVRAALRGKSFAEAMAILQTFADANRPRSGVREFLSTDGAVYIVIGANGTRSDPDGASVRLVPRGRELTFASAGHATHAPLVFIFGRGGSGGSVTIERPALPYDRILAIAGNGGYGGTRGGAGGTVRADGFRDWVHVRFVGWHDGLNGESMWGSGGGGGGGEGFGWWE